MEEVRIFGEYAVSSGSSLKGNAKIKLIKGLSYSSETNIHIKVLVDGQTEEVTHKYDGVTGEINIPCDLFLGISINGSDIGANVVNCVEEILLSEQDYKDIGNVVLYMPFYNNRSLKKVVIESAKNSENIKSISLLAGGCQNLEYMDLSPLLLNNLTAYGNPFMQCNRLKTLILGTGFFTFKTNTNPFPIKLSTWIDSSVQQSLVTNSYDRKANGLPDLTLSLSTQTKAVLSDSDKQTMTNKGYIIA